MTERFGIIGWPLSHTLSPKMHQAAYAALHIEASYEKFPLEHEKNLPQHIATLKEQNVRGYNVTVPYKEAILPLLDEVSISADAIGAVNTVMWRNGRLLGENTDWSGFLAHLNEANIDLKQKSAAVIGAGGSARAICFALASAGVKHLSLLNRSPSKLHTLKHTLNAQFPTLEVTCLSLSEEHFVLVSKSDVVVQTTSVGLSDPNDTLWPSHVPFRADQVVYELIYGPRPTALLEKAKRDGAITFDGLGMLLWQGVLAFEQFLPEHKAPVAVMRHALG